MADDAHATSAPPRESQHGEPRRGFLVQFMALVTGGVATMVPLAAGVFAFLDPLRRRANDNGYTRVATLDSVPDDGIPREFPVLADRTDAWNRYPNEPVGAVYLRRVKGETTVAAYSAICPHAGCFVDYAIEHGAFQCPCHDSKFEPDGARVNPESCPSPRDLDTLKVDEERLADGEVWVEFKNFRAGRSEKVEDA